ARCKQPRDSYTIGLCCATAAWNSTQTDSSELDYTRAAAERTHEVVPVFVGSRRGGGRAGIPLSAEAPGLAGGGSLFDRDGPWIPPGALGGRALPPEEREHRGSRTPAGGRRRRRRTPRAPRPTRAQQDRFRPASGSL